MQIKVGGSQKGAPSPNELVRFPGAYKDNDAGILVNAFGDAAYKFPGPAVSKLGSTSSDDMPADSEDVPADSDDSTETDGTDEDAGSPSSSSSPVPSSGTSKTSSKTKTPAQPSPSVAPPKKGSRDCKPAKKRATYADLDDSIPYVPAPETSLDDSKPRHMSRVMARIVKRTH